MMGNRPPLGAGPWSLADDLRLVGRDLVLERLATCLPRATVGMVPSCLFDVVCQNDAHGRREQFHQLFPRAWIERL